MTVLESSPVASKEAATGANALTNGDAISDTKPGMITDVKNLYQSKPDDRGKTTWVDTYPDDLQEAAENAESARYALLIRNSKCYDGRKKLEIDSIVVQSPLLKRALGSVLIDYPGITTALDRLTFKAPFQPFIHRWKNLLEALESEQDLETKAHLELFHRVLEAELRDDLKARDDFILNGVITYGTLWMIFEPGTTVFAVKDGQNCAARFDSGSYQETRCGKRYSLSCQIVDWDGEAFGLGGTQFHVWEFEGTNKITKLSAYPLEYHPNLFKVKEALIQRGKMFEELSGYHYKNYQGIAIGEGPWGPIKYNVDSRIIIDTYAWNRFNPNHQVAGEQKKPTALTNDQLLLCSASLKGYSLKNKEWLTFSIGSVSDIVYSENAFQNLVLPEDHKELILALAESQVQHRDSFDDVIQGKGKGMIMLLSGPPGVGKTLTAESVAETMRAPLYMMSAGDLGTASHQVERSLSNVLEMASKWNAVLLLDEADVFLEQRSSHDLERNKLVSIFLRILEYYEGILFLTTNRVDNIDAAFQSRIHISMQYGELSASSRRHVWVNFLNASSKGKPHDFSDKDLDKLAGYKMNGREIKNVLKTAQLLASKKGKGLCYQHVESVLAIEQRHVGDQAQLHA
ncbi:putative AAA family ATPase [Usnea florida]